MVQNLKENYLRSHLFADRAFIEPAVKLNSGQILYCVLMEPAATWNSRQILYCVLILLSVFM